MGFFQFKKKKPRIASDDKAQSSERVVTFDAEAGLVAHCPQELLVSFGDESKSASARDAMHEFMYTLRADILRKFSDMPAAVTYCIVSEDVITMCIPAANPETIKEYVHKKLTAQKIDQYMFTVVDRDRA